MTQIEQKIMEEFDENLENATLDKQKDMSKWLSYDNLYLLSLFYRFFDQYDQELDVIDKLIEME